MKTAVITGSEGAIGQALVAAFVDDGYQVIGLDLAPTSRSRANEYIQVDLGAFVNDDRVRQDALAKIKAFCATGGLTALINCAAVQKTGSVKSLSISDWRETFDVNVFAAVILMRELLEDLEQLRGAVVNISSIHASQTKPGFAAYAASKAALSGLTRALAVELGGSVRVNAIQPAAIATPMLRSGFENAEKAIGELGDYHPVGRIGRPEEVASLSLYLCSPAAGFLNGAVIGLDGGIASRLYDPA